MTSTIISWGLTLALIVGVTYHYKPDLFKRLFAQSRDIQSKVTTADSAVRPSSKRSKSKKSVTSKLVGADNSAPTSSNENQVSKKRKVISTPTESTGRVETTRGHQVQSARVQDGDLGDKEFAQQLARAQTGTAFKKPDAQQTKKGRRASKQSPFVQPDSSGISTGESSTTGRDADDDSSPIASPPLEPTRPQEKVGRSGDVSDMLETPSAGPTTLRLTSIPDDSKNKKKPAAKSFEPVITKKKRNEQARKEEMRQLREESDRIHEAKKQEQLRRARMAAGTSNQTKANNFASTSNAWQSKPSTAVKQPPANDAPLLDTFEPTSGSTTNPQGAVHTESLTSPAMDTAGDLKDAVGEKAAGAITASSREGLSEQKSGWTGYMSEEDQMKLLTQQQAENSWESVSNKKSKKKGRPENDSASEASSSVHKQNPSAVKAQTNGVKNTAKPKVSETINRFDSFHAKSENGLTNADWEA